MDITIDISAAADESELVRMLAMLRLRSDLAANSKGITEHSVLGFSDSELESLHETLIVHIVSDYFIMRKNGVKDSDIFDRLDIQRHLIGRTKKKNNSTSLSSYIKQRFLIEFPQLTSLDEKVIDMEILYAVYWFTKENRSTQDWEKADSFAKKIISDLHQQYLSLENIPTTTKETFVEESSPRKRSYILAISIILALAISCTAVYLLIYFTDFTFTTP